MKVEYKGLFLTEKGQKELDEIYKKYGIREQHIKWDKRMTMKKVKGKWKLSGDSHLKSILKALSWRVVATTTTILVSYIITGHVGTALKIGAIEVIAKIFIYYLHERIWLLKK